MRLLLPVSLSLLLFARQAVCAQSADDSFNTGAQFYISNNIANAKQVVESGLKLYPSDVKLKKLEELLKQQQQQQQNQQQSKQNQQNQQQSQQNQNQPPQQQQNQNSAQNQNQQNQQPQSSKTQQNEKSGDQNGQTQAAAAREMSAEEAQRLLDAQKGDEQFLQLKPPSPPESQKRPLKDW
jgi:hypothetical protein